MSGYRRIAFLDRDDTISRDYADSEWAGKREPELLTARRRLWPAYRAWAMR